MSEKLSRGTIGLILVVVLVVIFLGVTNAVHGAPLPDDAGPYPEAVPVTNQSSGQITSLILGAAVIVVIIWGGVALRRRPR